jgi:putative endonuclease
MKEKRFYWIYMLRLENGSYYTGYARDLVRRYRRHRQGTGARTTRSFPPVQIAACWKLFSGRGAALRVEAWIKSCTRRQKQELVEDPRRLLELVRRRAGNGLTLVVQDPRFLETEADGP